MASNRIPENYDPLVQLLEDAADGATTHGASIGIKQNDGPTLRGVLVALVGTPRGAESRAPAVPGLKAQWNAAKSAKTAATAAIRTAISNGRALAMACVGTLKPRLGTQWNGKWEAAGFTNHSLETPVNPQSLLLQLRAYYSSNASHEIADVTPTLSCTAAACQAAADAIQAADLASSTSNKDAGTAKKALDAGMDAARARLSGLREELGQLLADDDERWVLFGFDLPSAPETPEVPANLVATPGAAASGKAFADWDDARRADSYRLVATDAATGTVLQSRIVAESEAMLEGLPTGKPIHITVSARNDAGGESAPSTPVTITLA